MHPDVSRSPLPALPARSRAIPERRTANIAPRPARPQPARRPADDPDPDLLARCAAGDEAAWTRLVVRYQGLVYSTALGVGLDQDDANDVFQYVWIELHRSISRLRNPRGLARWLMVATRRHSYKVAAKRRRMVSDTFQDMTDPAAPIDQQVEAAESRVLLGRALDAIDARCRAFLKTLFFSSDKTPYEEIGSRFNLAIGSIGPTRSRCLAKLRRALGDQDV